MKSRFILAACVCLVSLPFVSLNGAPGTGEDMAQIRSAVDAGNLKFGEAVRKGDAAAIAALYSDDATILPPDSEMIQGKQAIQAFWDGGLNSGIKDAVLTAVSVTAAGDYAFEIGKARLTIQPSGQEAMEQEVKYVVVWKKSAMGSWQLHVDIWNSVPAK
jgi:uncharacterized protein (TIGR02246 family)